MEIENSESAIWQKACNLLTISDQHVAELAAKRGLHPDIIQIAQLRSSRVENRAILSAFQSNLTPEELDQAVRCQLLVQARSGEIYPNPLFCGRGLTGEEDEDGYPIRKDGLNPVLIPYLDAAGAISTIRPHKDFLKRPEDTKDDDNFTSQRIYCPFLLRSVSTIPGYDTRHSKLCVITEGEFKQLALFQAGIPSIGFPGIQAIANYPFQKSLIETLESFGIQEVVIVFDNECKDDPALRAKYKPDPWDRYDSIVYAIIAAQTLRSKGFVARIGKLPDSWRENGKADWDGALASYVRQANGDIKEGTAKARKEFLKVIQEASERWKVADLFPSQAETIIEAKVSRHFHVPRCLRGDDKFARIAQRIRHENPALASAMLDCVGKYYKRKPAQRSDEDLKALRKEISTAKQNKDFAKATAIEQELLGFPEPLSNFLSDCDYRLIRADGITEYLVKFKDNLNNKTKSHLRVTSNVANTLSGFRQLTLSYGFTWKGGEKDLQDLTDDWQARSSRRAIHEVNTYGYNAECGLWKFGDRAFTMERANGIDAPPKSKVILPDKNMVFWHDGVGYQTDFRTDRVGDGFDQGAPILGELNEQQAAASFLLMTKHLYDALGDYTGWLLLGSIMAYCVHPEILKTYGGAPGIWLTGRKGSGKSTIAEWLVSIWGFPGKYVTLSAETTGTYVSREISKYECLPAWFDEFRDERTRPEVKAILQNAFNRAAGGKATYDQTNRTRSVRPGTTPLVTGESSSLDAATRSRYVNATVLADRALNDSVARLAIMKSQSENFRNLGHFLMVNRAEYAQTVMKFLDTWVKDTKLNEYSKDVRLRFVIGTPYCAWLAAAVLLQERVPGQADLFKAYLDRDNDLAAFAREMTSETQHDTAEVSFIMRFWDDIFNMVSIPGPSTSAIRKFVWQRYCRVEDKRVIAHQAFPAPGLVPALLIAPKQLYHLYEQEVRKSGREAVMQFGDIKRELKRERYWLQPPENESIIMCDGGKYACWAMDLVQHPRGMEFLDYFEQREKNNLTSTGE